MRQEIINTVCDFNASGLSVATSGNLSVKTEEGILITPSGIQYQALEQADIVTLDIQGNIVLGKYKPSTEWPFHCAIYQARQDVNAIVHVHSTYATAVACTRQPIPAFHYMVAIAGNTQIPCAEYATFGTDALSKNIVKVLKDSNACLMANHGLIALGKSLNEAYTLAHEVENLAKQYIFSKLAGEPVLLDDKEMQLNLEKFKDYKKQL